MGPLAQALTDLKDRTEERADTVQEAYGPDRPLRPLSGLIVVYVVVLLGLTALARRRGKLTERLSAADVVLYGVATFRLSRILAKDPITSPLRAPFTRLEGVAGPAELHEEVRGTGWRHAVGELLTCPFCLGQWVSTAFVFGGMLAPRLTRATAATFAVHAGADALQFAYAALERTDG
jgi:hypothetical protein